MDSGEGARALIEEAAVTLGRNGHRAICRKDETALSRSHHRNMHYKTHF
jgi:hypothetical protein